MVEQVVKGKRRTAWRAGLAAIVATAATASGIAAPTSALAQTPWGNPVPGGAASGYQFSLVMTAPDATGFNEVYASGEGTEGELGNGVNADSNVFVKVKNLTRVKMVAAGASSAAAVKQDGTVWVWGNNSTDVLGLDPSASVNVPTQVPGITNAVSVGMDSYDRTVVVVLADGTAKAWGSSTGNCAASKTPVTVAGLTGLATTPRAIAVGRAHVLALKADGTVKAWGSNSAGQLGTGDTTASCSPVTVQGLSGVTEVGVGFFHSVALTSSGTVKAWGHNDSGELGDGTTTQRLSPITVPGLTNVVGISAGARYTTAVTSAAAPANNRFAWGAGPLGTGGGWTTSPTPLAGENFNNTVIHAGPWHAISVQSGAVPRTWGDNDGGELGTGDYVERRLPTYVQRVG
ncbi:Regulator of chromosome condensation (RCC1) repeat protein [Actinomadura rubteroloni]|uniref:Regulator of chromosome condensation (RCC1) repeat protein n=1 Tax=Actinomadura rubteroloni TaxID=1926885 RepID=A0A2P4ULG3_9ACTN|nr:hypothetical protein [Actinomadura rubteroloni]POM25839.1 Regulator of chromosome condensation (RCC1) repeat protein [Actinomadura rubteroloni]